MSSYIVFFSQYDIDFNINFRILNTNSNEF